MSCRKLQSIAILGPESFWQKDGAFRWFPDGAEQEAELWGAHGWDLELCPKSFIGLGRAVVGRLGIPWEMHTGGQSENTKSRQ